MLTREEFIRQLRNDLNHLQDPEYLRRSPLATLFGVANRFDTPARLQAILIEGIQALEPRGDEPEQSQAWRLYDALFYRYVQRFPQEEVARQLGVCTRHVRRVQQVALEALAVHLWEKFNLETKVQAQSTVQGKESSTMPPALSEELAWLRSAPPEVPADLSQILSEAQELIQPLAERHGVNLRVNIHDRLPPIPVHPVALTQTILDLLGIAVHHARSGTILVSAWALNARVELSIEAQAGSADSSTLTPRLDNGASLETARALIETCGGWIEVSPEGEPFRAIVRMPAVGGVPVLVIDDNEDTLRLLQRYATGTRYRLITTRDPEQALNLAHEISPAMIVLDVMMPQMDGWRVLARLKQSPYTGQIPVLVCTILSQEELAYAIGASGFVRKPVTREAFLAALDRLYVLTERVPH